MIFNDILSLIDQCFAEPSSETLPPAEDGKEHQKEQRFTDRHFVEGERP